MALTVDSPPAHELLEQIAEAVGASSVRSVALP
jgi:hypothetical protein